MQPDIHVFDADVCKDEDIGVLRKQVEEITHGRLDVLVNNAYENTAPASSPHNDVHLAHTQGNL